MDEHLTADLEIKRLIPPLSTRINWLQKFTCFKVLMSNLVSIGCTMVEHLTTVLEIKGLN